MGELPLQDVAETQAWGSSGPEGYSCEQSTKDVQLRCKFGVHQERPKSKQACAPLWAVWVCLCFGIPARCISSFTSAGM